MVVRAEPQHSAGDDAVSGMDPAEVHLAAFSSPVTLPVTACVATLVAGKNEKRLTRSGSLLG